MKCLYCINNLRVHYLTKYNYYHCTNCKVEYLYNINKEPAKRLIKFTLNNKKCTLVLDFNDRNSKIVFDESSINEIKFDMILEVTPKNISNRMKNLTAFL